MMKKLEKKEVRKIVAGRRGNCSPEKNAAMSEKIRMRLFMMDEYIKAETIFVYVSFNNEVDTFEIIKSALSDGKKVAVPCTGSEKRMDFIRIDSLSELTREAMGIPEPEYDEGRVILPSEGDIIIMPGVAFDEEKNRAGYGGGYYDRWLCGADENIFKVALSFEFQVMKGVLIDTEEHDICPDRIITEERVF